MNMKYTMMLVAGMMFAGMLTAAVPSLKGTAEPVGSVGIKLKALAQSQAVPAATPQAHRFLRTETRSDGTERKSEITQYIPREVWMAQEMGCRWKDRKGNLLTVAVMDALCPDGFERDYADREDIEKGMKESAESFKEPTNATLAKWVSQFSEKSVDAEAFSDFPVSGVAAAKLVDFGGGVRAGACFKTKADRWYYAEFKFAAEPKPKEAAGLLKKLLASVVVDKTKASAGGKQGGMVVMGDWLAVEVPGYKLMTNLPKSQAGKFMDDMKKIMLAMQDSYRRYVPPQCELKKSTIRVFDGSPTKDDPKGRKAYDEYQNDPSTKQSIGLWDPSREELLVLNQGKDVESRRETMKILRHEAFHQYLFYATGGKEQAMWFNEGHATFFENVRYSLKNNEARFYEDAKDRRAGSVGENPQKYAQLVPKILAMDHGQFYAGNLEVVNEKYNAAWAAIYFLAHGAQVFPEFAAYKNVLPTYLKEVTAGKSWEEATKIAWEGLVERFPSDFLKFWNKRAGARNYRPPAPKAPTATEK